MAHNNDWYQQLVDQSRTDHIYSLIHENLEAGWDSGHDMDFVVLRKSNLPKQYQGEVPAAHVSAMLSEADYCFPETDYVLLDQNHLTEYLEAAKEMKIVADLEDREFIELLFVRTHIEPALDPTTVPANEFPDPYETQPWDLDNPEDALGIAYQMLVAGADRERALEFAEVGRVYLDQVQIQVGDDYDTLHELCRKMMGYNIVSLVYVWNDRINDAARIDANYLNSPVLWNDLESVIKSYLEMLMAKKCESYLNHIFEDLAFRERFRVHYEVYISLLVDAHYEWTSGLMNQIVPVINRVNNGFEKYV